MNLSEKYIRLIAQLKKSRISLSYSQQDVSLFLKKNQSFISKIENLNQPLSLNDFFTLCTIYKLRPSDLMQILEDDKL